MGIVEAPASSSSASAAAAGLDLAPPSPSLPTHQAAEDGGAGSPVSSSPTSLLISNPDKCTLHPLQVLLQVHNPSSSSFSLTSDLIIQGQPLPDPYATQQDKQEEEKEKEKGDKPTFRLVPHASFFSTLPTAAVYIVEASSASSSSSLLVPTHPPTHLHPLTHDEEGQKAAGLLIPLSSSLGTVIAGSFRDVLFPFLSSSSTHPPTLLLLLLSPLLLKKVLTPEEEEEEEEKTLLAYGQGVYEEYFKHGKPLPFLKVGVGGWVGGWVEGICAPPVSFSLLLLIS